jgi:heptosyltransferase-2
MGTMKIVVRAPNWIGDSVLALPAIESIKHNFPDAELWIAANDWVLELFAASGLATGVIPLPSSADLKHLRDAARTLKGRSFETAILFTNSFVSAFLFYLAAVPQRWGYSTDGRGPLLTHRVRRPDSTAPRHQVWYYLDLISGLGIKPLRPELRLSVPDGEKDAARRRLLSLGIDPGRPLVILSPGASYGPAKRWPPSRFAELAALFQQRKQAQILIIGAAAEEEIAAAICSSMDDAPAVLTGQTTLSQLLGLVGQATLVISNDTGPMHLANALGVPVVGIFGPTDPAVTRPFEQPSTVVKKDVPCWPCAYRTCPYDHRCMMTIEAEEVYKAGEGLWR